MKYFHAASRPHRAVDATMSTVVSVASSIATHIRPVMFAVMRGSSRTSNLIHRVIEAQIERGQASGFQLVRDIAGAEDAVVKPTKVSDDEDDVEVVDQQSLGALRGVRSASAERNVSSAASTLIRATAVPGSRENRRGQSRNDQTRMTDRTWAHRRSPRSGRAPVGQRCRSARGCGIGRCR